MTERSGFTPEQNAQLSADLDGRRVKAREGRGGKSFDYLETWDVEDRANKIFGFDGWSCETLELIETWAGERNGKAAMSFRARVRVTVYAGGRAVIKEAWGYGDGSGRDLGEASELAVKESESDAEKRAFKKFGHQFGLALYDKTQQYVRDGADDDVPTQVAPPPPPPKAPPAQARATDKAKDARKDPGAPKAKKFDAPEIPEGSSKQRIKDIWRNWSQQIAASVKAAPDEKTARAMLAANASTIASASKAGGVDMMGWAVGLIEQRWPPAQDDTAIADTEALQIPEPTTSTFEEWDGWLDLILAAIQASPNETAARAVLVANASGLEKASATVDMDTQAWAENKIAAKFKRSNVR